MSRVFRPSSSSGIRDAICWLLQRHWRIATQVEAGILDHVELESDGRELYFVCSFCREAFR